MIDLNKVYQNYLFSSFNRKREFLEIKRLRSKKEMAAKYSDQEFVEYVVKGIVGHPDDVSTERTVDEMGVLITLKINQEDMGYVIGRQGQTARAIRTLLKIVGAKNHARVNLKIHEPEGSRRFGVGRRSTTSQDIDTEVVDDLKI